MEFIAKRVLVLGLGISGKAAASCLKRRGCHVVAIDQNADNLLKNDSLVKELASQGVLISNESSFIEIQSFDLAIASPGIPSSHPIYLKILNAGIELIGEAELAARLMPEATWIGVTGTNGKTTVTLLIAHVLNELGKPAVALGNIGTALCSEEFLGTNQIIVAELSSFQLETLQSKILFCGLLLNITPDHLDRYSSLEEYAAAKFRISRCLKREGAFYLEEETSSDWKSHLEGIPYEVYGFKNAELQLENERLYYKKQLEHTLSPYFMKKPRHDLANLMAAYRVCKEMGIDAQDFFKAAETFNKPPHRIEFVASINEAFYYNDSKGTNVDAVIKAVNAMSGPTILIAGGVHKGTTYKSWLNSFKNPIKAILAIGEAATLINEDLGMHIPVEICPSLSHAVVKASQMVNSGENVLFSPGCASFDMFKDYIHRGQEFKRNVYALIGSREGV